MIAQSLNAITGVNSMPGYDNDRCECVAVHQEAVDSVRSQMPEDDTLIDLADLFKMFSDSTRVRIMYALLKAELCVCDIAEVLGMTKSAVSHQLRSLRHSRLVKNRREGKTVYYSLADSHVGSIFAQGLDHVME